MRIHDNMSPYGCRRGSQGGQAMVILIYCRYARRRNWPRARPVVATRERHQSSHGRQQGTLPRARAAAGGFSAGGELDGLDGAQPVKGEWRRHGQIDGVTLQRLTSGAGGRIVSRPK